MRKLRKYFFGVFEDGPVLKIVQLINSNGHPILIDIKKTEMECSIYHDIGRRYESGETEQPNPEGELGSITEISMGDEGELDSVVSPHEHLLSIFPLNQGRLGLNANDEKLSIHYLDRSLRSLTRRDLIKLNLLSTEEMKDKDVMWGLVQTAQDQTCVIIHKGENRLFSYLQKYNQIQSERKYFYSLIDSNDISLINAIRMNYELNKEDDLLVIYLGYDYKKGILMKGEELVKSLPILTSSDTTDPEREICSRLALYQDEMEIPHVERIIVAGEYSQDAMLEAIANTFPAAEVERFKFDNDKLLFAENLGDELAEEELAANVIPISIAWKILLGKSNEVLQTNFLEKKIIKSQKVVQFSWHSVLMLAILMVLTYSFTTSIFTMQKQLNILKQSYLNKKLEYENLKTERDPGPNIQEQIYVLRSQINQLETLYQDKAIWSTIIELLSENFNKYPVSWLTNIQGNQAGFSIAGITSKQQNIVNLASIFPEGTIKSVHPKELEKQIVWVFEIRYNYPAALPIVEGWTAQNLLPVQSENSDLAKSENIKASTNPILMEYKNVIKAYDSRNFPLMIELAESFIIKNPDNYLVVNCQYLMGEIYQRQNNLEKAEKLLDQVLKKPGYVEPYALYKLAQVYYVTERLYLAQVLLNRITSSYPNNEILPKVNAFLQKLEDKHE